MRKNSTIRVVTNASYYDLVTLYGFRDISAPFPEKVEPSPDGTIPDIESIGRTYVYVFSVLRDSQHLNQDLELALQDIPFQDIILDERVTGFVLD